MCSGWDATIASSCGEGGLPDGQMTYSSTNGKSCPMSQLLRVREGDVLRLRLIAASIPVAFHLHGHDMLVTHKDGLPLPNPYYADVVSMIEGERYDVIVEMDNPGLWMTHDHIDRHTTNNGKQVGGNILVVEYEVIELPEWYGHGRIGEYDPGFYMIESMQKGPGLHDTESHRGVDLM